MTELAKTLCQIKGDRSIRQMAKDTGVSAAYLSGIIHGNYQPTLKILSKITDPKSHPQITISASRLYEISMGEPLCDDFDIELEDRIMALASTLKHCAEELEEISKLRASRHVEHLQQKIKTIERNYHESN